MVTDLRQSCNDYGKVRRCLKFPAMLATRHVASIAGNFRYLLILRKRNWPVFLRGWGWLRGPSVLVLRHSGSSQRRVLDEVAEMERTRCGCALASGREVENSAPTLEEGIDCIEYIPRLMHMIRYSDDMVIPITDNLLVCSTACSVLQQRKHSPYVRGIDRWSVNDGFLSNVENLSMPSRRHVAFYHSQMQTDFTRIIQ